MNTQITMTDTQTVTTTADIFDLQELADVELDAILALENAEIQSMQIIDSEDLAELEQLMSPSALRDLDALSAQEDWLLAS